jgi:hypothetical protein
MSIGTFTGVAPDTNLACCPPMLLSTWVLLFYLQCLDVIVTMIGIISPEAELQDFLEVITLRLLRSQCAICFRSPLLLSRVQQRFFRSR